MRQDGTSSIPASTTKYVARVDLTNDPFTLVPATPTMPATVFNGSIGNRAIQGARKGNVMTLVTVGGMFSASTSGDALDAEFDMVADMLIDLEDGILVDSALSADLKNSSITVEVTISTDESVADAEQIGFSYIEKAIGQTVGLGGVKNTARQAELATA